MLKCIITYESEPKINYFAAVYWYINIEAIMCSKEVRHKL